MKKLIFTLAIVALSGSSLFGEHRYQTKPIAPSIQSHKAGVTRYDDPKLQDQTAPLRQPQTAGVTAYDDPNLQECLNEKGRTKEALQECRDQVYGSGLGDTGKGVTHY